MSPWRRLDWIPAASSFTRASRSISEERSMPTAWVAFGPNSSIIRPVPVPISTKRPSGLLRKAPSIARSTSLSATWRERIWSQTWAWPVKYRFAASARSARIVSVRAASDPKSASVGESDQASTNANIGSTRSASASVRKTQLPSLRRSSTPASARIFRWRDTRGWLWPSTCASSPTDSSILLSSARIRSRVGSASACKRSASGRTRVTGIRI